MNHQKQIFVIVCVVVALFLGFIAWDYYKRSSWDNRIVSKSPTAFYVARKHDLHNLVPAYHVDVSILSEEYKTPLEIVKKGNAYYWVNKNNLLLKKTFEYRPRTKNGVTDERGFRWVVFTNEDNTIKIKIQGNDYLGWSEYSGYGCYKNGFYNNSYVLYDIDKNFNSIKPKKSSDLTKKIIASAPAKDWHLVVPLHVYVYDNVFQDFYCNK